MQKNREILIVDDEKNIRITFNAALSSMGFGLHDAANGEEALTKLDASHFDLALLDLSMPGIGGIEVLRRARAKHPKVRFIIVTAHGTIDSAVEAMKLGAVDFIQKPCTPEQIRDIVSMVLGRDVIDERSASDYGTLMEICKRYVSDRDLVRAREVAQRAIGIDPGKPDAYNLLGALIECKGDREEAQRYYRAALEIDPSYTPARNNLARTGSLYKFGKITIEE